MQEAPRVSVIIPNQNRLDKKEYWDTLYKLKALEGRRQTFLDNNLKRTIKTLFGKNLFNYIKEYVLRSYSDYILWDVIYKKYLPDTKGLKALEIGSAPGDKIVRLNRTFGFIPYGVEYSGYGVALNRNAFSLHGINPDNVIHADFLSEEFLARYAGYFDIVISNGVIEHFIDVKKTIEKHINLLAKGGCLVVSIPNFKGVNYIFARLFHKWFLQMHNLSIMDKKAFAGLFSRKDLRALFCGYYGVFNFGLFDNVKNSRLTYVILYFCNALQLILNAAFRLLCRDKQAENGFFSPYLIFIGINNKGNRGAL